MCGIAVIMREYLCVLVNLCVSHTFVIHQCKADHHITTAMFAMPPGSYFSYTKTSPCQISDIKCTISFVSKAEIELKKHFSSRSLLYCECAQVGMGFTSLCRAFCESLSIEDWLFLLEDGSFFARVAVLSVALFPFIGSNGSGASC